MSPANRPTTLTPRRETLLALVASVVLASIFCAPLTEKLANFGISDWDQHLTFHAVPRRTITHWGQVPLWNPYNSGGLPDLANPQSRILSPTFPLILQFGTLVGIRLDIAVHCAAAFFFTWCLARRMGTSALGAAAGAATYGFGGLIVYPLAFGMTWSLGMTYVPLALLGLVKSMDRLTWSWLGGLALALMLFSGGAYVLILTGVLLGLYAASAAVSRRSVRPLVACACMGLFAVGFAAPKLFPAVEFMAAHPRTMTDESGFSVWGLYYSLFDRNQQYLTRFEFEGTGLWEAFFYYYVDENFMYVGIPAGILCLIGILTSGRRQWPLLLTMGILLWLCLGTLARPLSLWDWLHGLPVLKSMRVAQRFRIPWMVCFAIFTAIGTDVVIARLVKLVEVKPRAWTLAARGLAAAAVGALVADLIVVNGPVWSWAFNVPPPPMAGRPIFRQARYVANYGETGYVSDPSGAPLRSSSSTGLLPAFVGNIGVIMANESALYSDDPALMTSHVIPADDPGYKGEVYVDGGSGSAIYAKWTPMRLVIELELDTSGMLVVNQNWDAGWRCEDGRPVERYVPSAFTPPKPESGAASAPAIRRDVGGVIAVRVAPPDKRVVLYYDPPSFRWGVAAFALTTLTATSLGVAGWKRRRRRAA